MCWNNDKIKSKTTLSFILKAWGVPLLCFTNRLSLQTSIVWLSLNINTYIPKEQEEAERHQKGKYAKKGIDTLRDNFYLKRTDLLEKANWIISLILYFCCDIIKMHVAYQYSLFCIHNLKLKLISCHTDLIHVLMVPGQKFCIVIRKAVLYIHPWEKQQRRIKWWTLNILSSVQKIAISSFSSLFVELALLIWCLTWHLLPQKEETLFCLSLININ